MREPIFNWPILICLIVMGVFVYGLRYAMESVFDVWGFGTGVTVGLIGTGLIIIAAFSYDYFQARRSRRLRPSEPPVPPLSSLPRRSRDGG